MKKILWIFSFILIVACSNDHIVPKPKAQLRLEYPAAQYHIDTLNHFTAEISDKAQIERISDKKLNLVYPEMKAKIYLTYNPIRNNLKALLRDAEKFTYEHTIKADEIITRDFINQKDSVFGTINLVTGNAASQIQFHATDSVRHFLDGSLYFYAQPNYDSIMPAVKYLQNDIQHLLETLKWHK